MYAKTLSAACLAALIFTLPATAQDPHAGHGAATTSASTSPSTQEFEAANARMHKDMAIAYTGKADVDFVRSMIPHHQGAIDMARIELKHGKNPEIRRLAEEVIRAQEAEIAMMRDWLAKNAH
ncbi:DUF305 domain-containing protein [Rhizobium sp. FY34]|uniref:CopM family metallochaperone n=1 Tax=Rhizobium sp. FY34 TaxID=2562309 RepID=UPI0010BFE37F|nr:DUF305 domain-containing protein [Rhizobium sp. FY34]